MTVSRKVYWLVAALITLVAVITLLGSPGEKAPATAASRTRPAASDPASVERGRYLALAANCASCHTRPGGAPFSGGVAFETPFGTIYSSNITADPVHGIGNSTFDDLKRALHEGISAKGYRLFPAFPYTSFTRITDEDVKALYGYLQTIAPSAYDPPVNGFLFKQRWAMAIWDSLFFRPGRFTADSTRSPQWNQGAYLVDALGHCSACHSPRNAFMAEVQSKAYQGGSVREHVDRDKVRDWSAVNLTSSPAGLEEWNVAVLAKYLHTGFSPRAGTFGPMNEVVVNSTSQLTAEDVLAMATYIKSLPVDESAGATPGSAEASKAGEGIYHDRCAKCHGDSGRGGMFMGPPLFGSAIVRAPNPASLINVILYGAAPPTGIILGAWETMQPYTDVLSDSDVAAVATYVRGAWGNRASRVDAATIAKQR
jgi:alcohol dehydrogenase (quinone), cytochrome c subunit